MSANDPMHLGHMAAEAELVKAFLRTKHPVELSDAEIADYQADLDEAGAAQAAMDAE